MKLSKETQEAVDKHCLPLDKEVKERWIAALRSGDYEQGYRQLMQECSELDEDNEVVTKRYCCLGVLCDLFLKDEEASKGLEPEWDDSGHFVVNNYRVSAEEDAPPKVVLNGVPPNPVNAWARGNDKEAWKSTVVPLALVKEVLGHHRSLELDITSEVDDEAWKIAYINDKGATFDEIASILEHFPVYTEEAA